MVCVVLRYPFNKHQQWLNICSVHKYFKIIATFPIWYENIY